MLPVRWTMPNWANWNARVSRCGVLWWTIHRQYRGDCPDISGVSPMGLNDIPATDPRKAPAVEAAGASGCGLCSAGPTPSDVLNREAFLNAVASVAVTESTNAVLHLLAIAREVGVELTLEDFHQVNARTPWLRT